MVVGVSPAELSEYQLPAEGKPWKCKDGTLSLPFAAVNDEYCDCGDGSDEPGTSACAGVGSTTFWCANAGYVEAHVPVSRVNDGICDCCDGSDEHGGGSCADGCAALAIEANREISRG